MISLFLFAYREKCPRSGPDFKLQKLWRYVHWNNILFLAVIHTLREIKRPNDWESKDQSKGKKKKEKKNSKSKYLNLHAENFQNVHHSHTKFHLPFTSNKSPPHHNSPFLIPSLLHSKTHYYWLISPTNFLKSQNIINLQLSLKISPKKLGPL